MTLPMIPSTLMPDPWPATIHPSIEHAVDEGDGLVQRQRHRRDPLALGARTASISRRISALPPLARVTAMDARPPRSCRSLWLVAIVAIMGYLWFIIARQR